MTTILEIYITS